MGQLIPVNFTPTDDRIDKTVPRTDKVRLTCSVHSTKRWATKNIGWIGARTIFYDGDTAHSHNDMSCQILNQYPDSVLAENLQEQEECSRSSDIWPCTGTLVLLTNGV